MIAERKMNLNIFGFVLIVTLAAYSLFCLYVGTFTLIEFVKVEDQTVFSGSRFVFSHSVLHVIDKRSFFFKKWGNLIGIPSYCDFTTKIMKQNAFQLAKVLVCIAYSSFVLASLIHSYIALRTLFQPSYAVGTHGTMLAGYFFWSTILRIISELIYFFFMNSKYATGYGMAWVVNSYIVNNFWAMVYETEDDTELVDWINLKPWQYDPDEKF